MITSPPCMPISRTNLSVTASPTILVERASPVPITLGDPLTRVVFSGLQLSSDLVCLWSSEAGMTPLASVSNLSEEWDMAKRVDRTGKVVEGFRVRPMHCWPLPFPCFPCSHLPLNYSPPGSCMNTSQTHASPGVDCSWFCFSSPPSYCYLYRRPPLVHTFLIVHGLMRLLSTLLLIEGTIVIGRRSCRLKG